MNRFEKLDEAKELLLAENNSLQITYAMLFGYLSAMATDETAEAVLEMVKERSSK